MASLRAQMLEGDREALEARLRTLSESGDARGAAVLAVEQYGPEILGLLVGIMRTPELAADAFSQFCEDLWRGLPRFRGDSSFRTWAYTLARHAAQRVGRDPNVRRCVPCDVHPELMEVEARARTTTLVYLRTDAKDRIRKLREQLSEEEQLLLILRVDRGMAWNEMARILHDDAEITSPKPRADDAELAKRAAALRKRFERVKEKLRDLLAKERTAEL